MYKTEAGRILVDPSDLDVKATLECGQLFRYEKSGDVYTVKCGEKVCKVYASGDHIVIETAAVDYFVYYFQLDRDVERAKRELSRFPELTDALNSCGGLRLLRQPLFETIISFIVSANNNIPRIRTILNRMCALFGDVFPSPKQLAELPVRQLDAIGCGYRSSYIHDTATMCVNSDILTRIYSSQTVDAQKLLMTMPGVGQKIADCVALFALGRLEVFPIDTWMMRVMREGMETELQLRKRLMDRYGLHAGYAQQVMYYYNAILKAGK